VKVRVGFNLGSRATGAGTADDAEWFHRLVDDLERLRFDSLWVSERLSGPGPSPLVAMSMAAARTHRLKFGMSVMVLPGRNPVVVAKDLATLDRLSGGRLLPAFGLGVANSAEHQAFGVRRDERAAIFDESLSLIRRLWSEDDVTHHGERFSLDGITVRPRPLQSPLEVWMGGVAPSELRRVGRLSDGWLPSFVTADDVRHGIDEIRRVAAGHNREIDPEHFGVLIPYSAGGHDAGAADVHDRVMDGIRHRRPDVDPADVVATSLTALGELIERFVEAGASKFVVAPVHPLRDVTDELEALSATVRPLES
jgi:probable F420-dependent oxidoreductase